MSLVRTGSPAQTAGAPLSQRRHLLRWTGWFLAANAGLVLLVSLRNLAVTDPPQGLLPTAFVVLMFVGHATFLAFTPAPLLVALVLLWPRRTPLTILATLIGSVLVFATAIDSVIYHQYRFHLNAEVFNLLFGGAAGDILVFSVAMYLQAALVVCVIVVCEVLVGRFVRARLQRSRSGRWGPLLAAVLFVAFATQAVIHAWADVAGYTPVTRQGRILPGYIPWTAEKLFRELGFEIERADAALLASFHGTSLDYPRAPLECADRGDRPNILWIVIDGWRRDALGPRVTPNLHRFAMGTERFTDHLSGGSATRTALFAMFYSLPGTYWHAMLAERRGPVLIDELLRRDYAVEIFSSASLVNPEFDRTAFARLDDLRLRSDGARPADRDRDATDDFLAFLATRDPARPFFSMLFFDAPHGYDVPDSAPRPFQPSWETVNYLTLDKDTDPEPFHNLYRNAVHFNDALAGEVLDALETRGLTERTIVLVTGDHGQEFNELGLNYWGHDSNFAEYQIAVPLLLAWPGRPAATHAHRTSHYDLAPTLLRRVFGCENDPDDYGVGRDLFEPGGREHLLLANYTDYAVVTPDRIIAVYPYGVELLDLRYRKIPGAELDRRAMLTALDQRGRFYK